MTPEKEKYYLWSIPIQDGGATHMIIAYDPTKNEEYPIGVNNSCDAFKKLQELRDKGHYAKQVYFLLKNLITQLEFRTVIHI